MTGILNALLGFIRSAAAALDPYFNQVVLLLHGDGNQGPANLYNENPPAYLAFADNSSNNFPITVNGDAYGTTVSPYQGNYSNFFDGTGDWLSVADNAAFALGSGNFTVEAWVFNGVTGARQIICGQFDSGGTVSSISLYLEKTAANKLLGGVASGSTLYTVTSTSDLPLNQWVHVALVRNGNTGTLYINGTADGTVSLTGVTVNDSSNSFSVGRGGDFNGLYFTGYISNFRLVKGTAVYTSNFTPPTTPLTAISGTSLLTCQSNRFIDNSSNNFAITRNGDTLISPFQPFTLAANTSGAGYFDGTGDYLSVANNAAFQFGTGNFTVEFWVYANSSSATHGLVAASLTGSGYWASLIFSGLIYWQSQNGTTNLLSASYSGYYNIWTHVAFVRNSGTTKLYLNGIEQASASDSTNYNGSSGNYDIGRDQDNTALLTGYLSNVRIVKGTAVYTSNFTPPTTPLTAITNTSLLTCQYSGTVNNTGFIDSGPYYFPITKFGNTTQGTFSPFSLAAGQWSNYFDGTGDSLSITNAAALDLDANFTIEAWIYPTSLPNAYNTIIITSNNSPDAGGIGIWATSAGEINVYGLVTNSNIIPDTSGFGLQLNQWTHIAVTRSGSTVTLYKNGVSFTTGTSSSNFNSSTPTVIGNSTAANQGFFGYISNLRIVKGSAIAPSSGGPTTPLTAISGTSLLTCQSNRFVDNSTNNFTITRNGDVRVTPFSPFAPTAAYDPAVNGGSGYFDGTGDYLTAPNNAAFDFGSGDFTIEGWFYQDSAITKRFVAKRATSTSFGPFLLIVSNSGQITFAASFSGTNTDLSINSSSSASIQQWNHVAVTRSGSSWTLWLNGTSVGTATSSSSLVSNTAAVSIGAGSADGNAPFNGYLSNFRLVKGTAVYTSAFTPSTTPLTAITNTSLLLNFTNAGIFDQTGKNNLETVGNAQIDTAVKKYGTGSMKFDGTGDYLLLQNSPELAFGTGAFTIEFWYYSNDTGVSNLIYDGRPAGLNGAYVTISKSTGNVITFYTNTANQITGTTSLAANTWYHIAVARSGTSTKLFINGTQEGSTYTDSNDYINGTSRPIIGAGGNILGNLPLNGYIDDLRVTKGVARYTANFTPPTQAFPNQ
jgi:hypothetical protein